MKTIEKLIFVEDQGNERAVMAKALFEEEYGSREITADARGIVVLFSQPVNQKVKVLLAGDGLTVDGFSSKELSEQDFSDTTLVLTMERRHKENILKKFLKTVANFSKLVYNCAKAIKFPVSGVGNSRINRLIL